MSGIEIHIVVGPAWILLTWFIAFAIVLVWSILKSIDLLERLLFWWEEPHWWKRKGK
jgi:hypothetical protein